MPDVVILISDPETTSGLSVCVTAPERFPCTFFKDERKEEVCLKAFSPGTRGKERTLFFANFLRRPSPYRIRCHQSYSIFRLTSFSFFAKLQSFSHPARRFILDASYGNGSKTCTTLLAKGLWQPSEGLIHTNCLIVKVQHGRKQNVRYEG